MYDIVLLVGLVLGRRVCRRLSKWRRLFRYRRLTNRLVMRVILVLCPCRSGRWCRLSTCPLGRRSTVPVAVRRPVVLILCVFRVRCRCRGPVGISCNGRLGCRLVMVPLRWRRRCWRVRWRRKVRCRLLDCSARCIVSCRRKIRNRRLRYLAWCRL